MKKSILIILSVLTFTLVDAQSDSPISELEQIPNAEYAVYKYDSTLQIKILTYQYSDICDLDNDGIKDSIIFIGNGGAHTYFNLKLRTSSNKEWHEYQTLYIDMPYLNDKIDEMTQFAVSDFDNDGVDEIYLNIDNSFGLIPENLKTNGLTSKRLIIQFENRKLLVKNFEKK